MIEDVSNISAMNVDTPCEAEEQQMHGRQEFHAFI